jgi:hypothetical protein
MSGEYKTNILEFQKFVTAVRKKTRFQLEHNRNMDEFPLTSDVPSGRAVDIIGDKLSIFKTSSHEETHNTAILACSADGTKLPLLTFE